MKFWDTSAILALVFEERHSPAAKAASEAARRSYAWSWLRVEAQAALARRRATDRQWERLVELLDVIQYVEIPAAQFEALCRVNREWRLRASDAGHLYCFRQCSVVIPDLELVCFDTEIVEAAEKAGLRLWRTSGAGPGTSLLVRERRGRYGSRKR